MNANELADDLDNANGFQYVAQLGLASKAATMLRQQQAEIEALRSLSLRKENLGYFYDLHASQQAEIESLKSRELTDEEILEIAYLRSIFYEHEIIGFARAILRKAQEK